MTKSDSGSIFPTPFNVLSTVVDSRLKGKRVLLYLSFDLSTLVYMAPPGVGIRYLEEYQTHVDWIFIQCTNCVSFSPGQLAVARILTKSRDKFCRQDPGFISECFLCTPQYLFKDIDGELKFGIKVIRSDKKFSLHHILSGDDNAAEMLFHPKVHIYSVDCIDIVYLNRATGPKSTRLPSLFKTYVDPLGITWYQQGERPDAWSSRILHRSPVPRNVIRSPGTRLLQPRHHRNCRHKRTLNDNVKSSSYPCIFPKLENKKSIVWLCQDHHHYLPFTGGFTYELINPKNVNTPTFTTLSPENSEEFENEYSSCHIMSQLEYNEALLSFSDPIFCSHRTSLNCHGFTSNTFISLCSEQEFSRISREVIPPRNEFPREVIIVSNNIRKILLHTTPNGDLDIPAGFPVQQNFVWPYDGISCDHVDVIKNTFHGSETPRTCTCHFGLFQSIGFRVSSRCSSSLCEHPSLKKHNMYWNWSMNPGLFPFASSIRNSLFRQAHDVSHTYGGYLSKLQNSDPDFDYKRNRASLVSINYANNIHRDSDWQSTPCFVSHQLEKQSTTNPRVKRYNSRMKQLCGDRIPVSTTCCWSYMDRADSSYQMRQFFLNVTAGISQDITSSAYKYCDQIGANFFGSMFDHCTTRPIWIRSLDGGVTLKCPSDNAYNFAWGKHK